MKKHTVKVRIKAYLPPKHTHTPILGRKHVLPPPPPPLNISQWTVCHGDSNTICFYCCQAYFEMQNSLQ